MVNSRREALQITFLVVVLVVSLAVFFFTPTLQPASLMTVLNVIFLGPLVKALEKRKVPRIVSILGLYLLLSLFFVFGITRLVHTIAEQWTALVNSIPVLGAAAINKLGRIQERWEEALNIRLNLGLSSWLIDLERVIQTWALTNAPRIIGNIASAALLAPIFSFFILKDGERIFGEIQKIMPERHSKKTVAVVQKISASLGKFLRAKLIEAFLVGFLVYLGLKIIGAPYSGVFALIAGITNVIPYLGPILGVIPPLAMFGFSGQYEAFLWPSVFIFLIVNAVDMVLIFPIFVAKLVNLSPLTLLAAVAVGQEFGGVVGMLLAVPLASILKIIFIEVRNQIFHT